MNSDKRANPPVDPRRRKFMRDMASLAGRIVITGGGDITLGRASSS